MRLQLGTQQVGAPDTDHQTGQELDLWGMVGPNWCAGRLAIHLPSVRIRFFPKTQLVQGSLANPHELS
jgi:hypothetical protein